MYRQPVSVIVLLICASSHARFLLINMLPHVLCLLIIADHRFQWARSDIIPFKIIPPKDTLFILWYQAWWIKLLVVSWVKIVPHKNIINTLYHLPGWMGTDTCCSLGELWKPFHFRVCLELRLSFSSQCDGFGNCDAISLSDYHDF
jgi:hypothetical protein